jgi:hypothetical protein
MSSEKEESLTISVPLTEDELREYVKLYIINPAHNGLPEYLKKQHNQLEC